MTEPTQATVVYLRDGAKRICLALKKEDIHHAAGKLRASKNTWNGYGGKREPQDLTIQDTAIRELRDESGVISGKEHLVLCGHIHFFWPKNNTGIPDMDVYFYFIDIWSGEPRETAEMGEPRFFLPTEIPYDDMLEGDRSVLPNMLRDEYMEGRLYMGEKYVIGSRTYFVPGKLT